MCTLSYILDCESELYNDHVMDAVEILVALGQITPETAQAAYLDEPTDLQGYWSDVFLYAENLMVL